MPPERTEENIQRLVKQIMGDLSSKDLNRIVWDHFEEEFREDLEFFQEKWKSVFGAVKE